MSDEYRIMDENDPKLRECPSTPNYPNQSPEEVKNMTELERELDNWRRMVHDSTGDGRPASPDDYKSNVLLERWTPRWKWFQPPMWRIFRWAYKINYTYFTGVYPVAMSTSEDRHPDGILNMEFTCKKYTHPSVEAIASVRSKQLKDQIESIDKQTSKVKEEDGCSDT